VGNQLDDSDLSEVYSSDGLDEYYDEIRSTNQLKYLTAAAAVDVLLPAQSGHVLDIGCGNGEFAEILLRRCYHVSVHDVPEMNLDHLRRLGIATYQDSDWSALPDDRFDVITLLDVAEHVLRPSRLFQECHRSLKPGGVFYFHTPVVTRLDRLTQYLCRAPLVGKIARVWQRGRVNIIHLQNYTRPALLELLANAGFEDANVSIRNELSWPVSRYVRVHLCEKHGLPPFLATIFAPLLSLVLKHPFLNGNKAIVTAVRPNQ